MEESAREDEALDEWDAVFATSYSPDPSYDEWGDYVDHYPEYHAAVSSIPPWFASTPSCSSTSRPQMNPPTL